MLIIIGTHSPTYLMAKYCGGLIFVAFQNFSKDDEEGKNFTRKYNRG